MPARRQLRKGGNTELISRSLRSELCLIHTGPLCMPELAVCAGGGGVAVSLFCSLTPFFQCRNKASNS